MANPSFPFYPMDHLGDLNLRGSHPAAQGIWWSMVCYMAQGEPFGYLRLKHTGLTPPPGPPPATANGVPSGVPPGGARARASAVASGHARPPRPARVPVSAAGDLEPELPHLLGLPEELVRWAIQHLEHRGVFNRDEHGIIFCRRMVRWADARELRKRRAQDAYRRRYPNGKAAGKKPPSTELDASPGAVASGVPPGIAPGGPRAPAAARASGVPGGSPLTLSPPIRKNPPNPPFGKPPKGGNRDAASLIRARGKHA
jgi:hypothetical protein